MRTRPILLAAGLLVATALGGWFAFAPDESAATPTPATPDEPAIAVMVAARPLAEGDIVRPSDLRPRPAPQGVPAGAAAQGSPEAARLVGAVTRQAVASGDPVLPAQTVAPGDRSFLAAIVRPGHRAVAVPVDAVSSAGGLIWPGDRVDVILAQELRTDGVPLSQSVVADTVLRNVRVLSIDQRLDGAPAPAAKDATAEVAAAARPAVPATVTLEVTPGDAERVAVALTLGKLSLGLRSIAGAPEIEADAETWAGSVMPALARVRVRQPGQLSAPPAAPAASIAAARVAPPAPRGVRIYRGSGDAQ